MGFKFCTGLPHSIPWGQIFCFLKFTPTFRVMVFSKFQTVEYDHQHTHYLVFGLTSNSIHTFYRTFPGDKCFVFFFLISKKFFSFETLKLGNFERQFDTLVSVRWTSNFVQAFYRAFIVGTFFVFSNSPQMFQLWCSQNFGL